MHFYDKHICFHCSFYDINVQATHFPKCIYHLKFFKGKNPIKMYDYWYDHLTVLGAKSLHQTIPFIDTF